MRNLNQDTITQAVIACISNTPDARLKEVLTSLVQHLHAFAREVKLTDREWEQGIEFLTRVGHITDDKRQEFILLSDTLGLSTLVVAMNHDKPEGCTEATVFGPFHVQGAPHYQLGQDISNGAQGAPCVVRAPRWKSGRPTVKGPTTSSVPSSITTRRVACCSLDMGGIITFAASWRSPIPFRMTGRWATCCARRAATPGARRTCTSW